MPPQLGRSVTRPKSLRGQKKRICRVCRCTDTNACIDDFGQGCFWVEWDLCSACVGRDKLRQVKRK